MKRIRWVVLLGAMAAWPMVAADSVTYTADGVATWTPSAPAAQINGEYAASRWGMFDLEARLETPAAGKVTLTIAGQAAAAATDGTTAVVRLGRVYLEKDGKLPLTIETEPANAAKPLPIQSLVFTPAPEGKPIVQSEDHSITLQARDSIVHGRTLRYEYRPDKNTLGYWGNEKDWVSWDFELRKPGKFIAFVMHGSGGGSEIEMAVGEQKLNWTTKNTGGFHTFTFLEIGTLTLTQPGPLSLTLKPTKKVGGAIMDLRQVILVPVLR